MRDLLICGLAVYRISRMIALEEGPFGLFVSLRERVDPFQHSWLGRGLNCPLCISFWAGIGVAVVSRSQRGRMLLLPFALSGLGSFLYKMERKDE